MATSGPCEINYLRSDSAKPFLLLVQQRRVIVSGPLSHLSWQKLSMHFLHLVHQGRILFFHSLFVYNFLHPVQQGEFFWREIVKFWPQNFGSQNFLHPVQRGWASLVTAGSPNCPNYATSPGKATNSKEVIKSLLSLCNCVIIMTVLTLLSIITMAYPVHVTRSWKEEQTPRWKFQSLDICAQQDNMLQKGKTVLIVYRNGSTIHAKENCAAFPGRHFPLFCFSGPIQFGVSPQHFCLTLNLIRKSKLFQKSRRCQLLIQFSEFQCYETSFFVLTMFCVNDGSNISNL